MKTTKIKDWFKNHKNEIIGATIAGVCSGIGFVCGWYAYKGAVKHSFDERVSTIPIPNPTLADFGKVGEEIVKSNEKASLESVVASWLIGWNE